MEGSLLGCFKILEDSVKDLSKIFEESLQGSFIDLYQDLTRILGKVPKGSLLGSLQDPWELYEDLLQDEL